SLFIIDLMGLFFYNKIGSIISIVDLPTTNIIEPFFVQGAKRGQNFHNGLILFENQIQTTSASPYRTQVQLAASFLVCSLIFIEYEIRYAQID
ncbi:hypothetical protein, partial [Streptococcus pneumoniae]|uniref:hypothetical protein n=1 Tax=Streptococcus pneumoniae TaxID=1313 RepID=UPI001BCA8709